MKYLPYFTFPLVLWAATIFSGCKKEEAPTVQPPVRVSVIAVNDTAFASGRQFSGTTAAASSTTVSFSVAGTIERLYAEEGTRVVKGQLLGKLGDGNLVNANNIAQAELAEAEDAYARLKKLHDANALPDIKWVEVQQKVNQARNAAEISARALADASLYAPMSGVISRKTADAGQNVAPGQPVFEIITVDALDAEIFVPENEIDNIALGQSAVVEFDNHSPLAAKVSQKSVVADPLTRSYRIKLTLSGDTKDILPGMVCTVSLTPATAVSSPAEAVQVTLPSQAVILNHDNRTYVWVVKDGKAERRFVTADELVAEGVLITSGLAPGDTVIVEGMQKVGTGSKVEPVIKK